MHMHVPRIVRFRSLADATERSFPDLPVDMIQFVRRKQNQYPGRAQQRMHVHACPWLKEAKREKKIAFLVTQMDMAGDRIRWF
jgi:hypothetical protein